MDNKPNTNAQASAKNWKWWVGSDECPYTTSCDTKDEAARIAREEYEGAWICEAHTIPVKLSESFEVGRFIENANENAYDYIGENGDELFNPNAAAIVDLSKTIRAAMDAWQVRHDLKFTPHMFTEQRNVEYIEGASE